MIKFVIFCSSRLEMTSHGKFAVIMVVWLTLIVFTFLYFYFCEWRLFPHKNRLKEMERPGCDCAEAGNLKNVSSHKHCRRSSCVL